MNLTFSDISVAAVVFGEQMSVEIWIRRLQTGQLTLIRGEGATRNPMSMTAWIQATRDSLDEYGYAVFRLGPYVTRHFVSGAYVMRFVSRVSNSFPEAQLVIPPTKIGDDLIFGFAHVEIRID